jgi:inosine-uridine nucleoside N-ribohydrolase
MPAAHLPPPGLLRCVLDTDTFNEVDDQFALAWMAKRPDRFDLLAVTAAPFHNGHSTGPADGMRKSVEEAERVLRLCGRGEVPVVPGSERFMLEGGPVESPAARRIIELAQEKPLHVVAIGALTNVASALRLEPGLKDRITLHWLGGHRPPEALNREFNYKQDVPAGDLAFGGVPLMWSPCKGFASHLLTTVAELAQEFEPRGELAAFLTNRVRQHIGNRPTFAKEIWDLAPVAWLLGGDDMCVTHVVPAPLGNGEIRMGTHIHRNRVFRQVFDDLAT